MNTAETHGFMELDEYTGVEDGVNVMWGGVFFGPRDSTIFPHTADSSYMGESNMNAQYGCIQELLDALLSVVHSKSLSGGCIPMFNIQRKPELWRRVRYALATRGTTGDAMAEQRNEALIRKFTTSGGLFSDVINKQIQAERDKVKKRREQEEKDKLSQARSSRASSRDSAEKTITTGFISNRPPADRIEWIQSYGNAIAATQNRFSDGWTHEEREERMRQLNGGFADGDNSSDQVSLLQLQDESASRSAMLGSVGGGGGDRAPAGGALGDILPKYELIYIVLPKSGDANGGEEEEEEEDAGPSHKRPKMLFESMGCDQEEACVQPAGGIVFAIVQMDPTINVGEAVNKEIQAATARRLFKDSIRASQRFGGTRRAYGSPSTAYDPMLDTHRDLLVGAYSSHSALSITKERLAQNVRMYTARPPDAEGHVSQQYPSDPGSYLHPVNWATLDNVRRFARAAGCDVSGLTPENVYAGYRERLGQNADDPRRDKFGLINLSPHIANDANGYQVYRVPVAGQVLVDSRPNKFGVLEAYFPNIDPEKVQTHGQLFAQKAAIAHEQAAVALGMEVGKSAAEVMDPLGMFPAGMTLHVQRQTENAAKQISFKEYRAPYETPDEAQHAYYGAQVLTAETLKSYSELPENWSEWMKAQRNQEIQCYPGFKAGMQPNARTNRFSLAQNKFGERMKKTRPSPTVQLLLHDVGKPLHDYDPYGPRHPEHPAMDAFAHTKVRNNYYLRQIKGVEAPLVVQRCQKVSTTCYHFKPGRLNPMYVLSGTAGTGKTYVIKCVNSLMVPDTHEGQNYMTPTVLTVEGSVDVAICTDEGAGILEAESSTNGTKNELAKTAIAGMGTVSASRAGYQLDAMGNRKLVNERTEVCHNNSFLIATNNKECQINEAMRARAIFIYKKEAFSLAVELTFESIAQMNKAFRTSQQLQQHMVYLVHKAVQYGFIPDFTKMPMVDIILQALSRWLYSLGVRAAENNNWDRVHNKIKIGIHDSVARNAIIETFNLPGATRFNVSKGGWELSFMREVSLKLFPTLQIIFWEVLEHEYEWIGDVQQNTELLKACLAVANYEWEEGHTASDQYQFDTDDIVGWRRRMDYTASQAAATAAGNGGGASGGGGGFSSSASFHRSGGSGADTSNAARATHLIDLNYVRVPHSPTLFSLISSKMPDWCRMQPSRIESVLDRMCTSSMFVPKKAPYKRATSVKLASIKQQPAVRTNGAVVTNSDLADRDYTLTGRLMPMVEAQYSKFGKGKGSYYIATAAPDSLQDVNLEHGLLTVVCSGVMRPRKIAVPTTHHEYHDIIKTINVTQTMINKYVEHKDAERKWTYSMMMARRGIFNREHLPPLGGEQPSGFAEEVSEEEEDELLSVPIEDDLADEEAAVFIGESPPAVSAASTGADNYYVDPADDRTSGATLPDMHRVSELVYDWREDKKCLSAQYGIQVSDVSAISSVGKAFMESQLDPGLKEGEWDKVQARVQDVFSGRMKFITVDPDDYSAAVRWRRCAMPLQVDGKAPEMPTSEKSLRDYLEYMRGSNLKVTQVCYPDDEIKAREEGGSIMSVMHGAAGSDAIEDYFPETMSEGARAEVVEAMRLRAEEKARCDNEIKACSKNVFDTSSRRVEAQHASARKHTRLYRASRAAVDRTGMGLVADRAVVARLRNPLQFLGQGLPPLSRRRTSDQ